jgi:NTP pyrophosphatase (non-canonical NTP hydrolase)
MTLNEYQIESSRTARMNISDQERMVTFALGLGGESGEVQDLIKKHIGHGHNLNREELKKEIGDVLWYIAALSGVLGFSLDEIAAANIEKLKKRYPDGFEVGRSMNREDI